MSDSKQAPTTTETKTTAPAIKVVLGTMELGRPQRQTTDEKICHQLVAKFVAAGHNELDTAVMYNEGESERILGRMDEALKRKVLIATKANPWLPPYTSLTVESVTKQCELSFANLKPITDGKDHPCVDIYYLHAPDHKTPIEQSLQAINALHAQGKFLRFGLSNYAAWQVAEIYYLCKINGWVLPTVYQGMYNGMTRDVERELFPVLRRLNIAFYAYNPLAGGILTGRYQHDDLKAEPTGRFFNNYFAPVYRGRYWHKPLFDAVTGVQTALDQSYPGTDGKSTVSLAAAALRWMLHHSQMSGARGDAMIIGASSLAQLDENVRACAAGPLDGRVVAAFDAGNVLTKPMTPQYFR